MKHAVRTILLCACLAVCGCGSDEKPMTEPTVTQTDPGSNDGSNMLTNFFALLAGAGIGAWTILFLFAKGVLRVVHRDEPNGQPVKSPEQVLAERPAEVPEVTRKK